MAIACHAINFYLYPNPWIFLALPICAYILKKYEILPIINYMTLDFKLYWHTVLYIANTNIVHGCITNDALQGR